MARWLQQVLGGGMQGAEEKFRKSVAPRVRKAQSPIVGAGSVRGGGKADKGLPNATIIYGIGAGLLFVRSLFLFVEGRWFLGGVVFIVGCCFTGFALHLLKHQD